ncbi:hypothetical protein [Ideonella dechloratans]|uniref:hypothetical protein n=1 Tax=Ideonella dechloratans TaxID=36863 RepID=UPI0035ADE828
MAKRSFFSRFEAVRSETGGTWGLILPLLAALLAGATAATGSLLPVMAVSGLIIGPLLMLNPRFTIWTVLLGAMVGYGALSLWNDALAAKLAWSLSGLLFGLLVVHGLHRLFSAAGAHRSAPHVLLMLWFMAYALIVSLVQAAPAIELITAFKRYFQAVGLIVVLAWAPFKVSDLKALGLFALSLALLQLPFSAFERIKLVPIREGLQSLYPGMVPIDVVAGTFGASMLGGGGSAEMATYLLFVLVVLLNRARHGLLSTSRLMWLAPLVALPLAMGETKVVVIFLPVLLFTLFRRTIFARPLLGVGIVVGGALLTAGLGLAYLGITGRDVDGELLNTIAYNFGQKGHGNNYLNRTTSLLFWAKEQGLSNPVSPVFGNGLGASHDATDGHIAVKHPGYGIGLTAAPTLLWDLGLVGFALYLAIFGAAWWAASRVRARAQAAWMACDAEALQATLPVLVIYTFYRLTPLEQLPFQMVMAAVLGYLAWLYRQLPLGPYQGRHHGL